MQIIYRKRDDCSWMYTKPHPNPSPQELIFIHRIGQEKIHSIPPLNPLKGTWANSNGSENLEIICLSYSKMNRKQNFCAKPSPLQGIQGWIKKMCIKISPQERGSLTQTVILFLKLQFLTKELSKIYIIKGQSPSQPLSCGEGLG